VRKADRTAVRGIKRLANIMTVYLKKREPEGSQLAGVEWEGTIMLAGFVELVWRTPKIKNRIQLAKASELESLEFLGVRAALSLGRGSFSPGLLRKEPGRPPG
jgi:hypothetical protein